MAGHGTGSVEVASDGGSLCGLIGRLKLDSVGFFTPLALVGEAYGFPLFGTYHLIYIAYAAMLVTVLTIVYRRLSPDTSWGSPRRIMLIVVSSTIILLKLSEISIEIYRGTYNVYWWPLHPCNICGVLCLLYALRPNKPTGEILYALGLPGSMAGILFADWIKVSMPWNWFCLCGFTEHALLIAFPLMLLLSHDFRPSMRRIWQPIVFVLACAPFIYIFNLHFGTNYWFINTPSPGSPLVLFADLCGDPGYLIPYAILVFGSWTLMYLPWRERKAKPRKEG